MLTTSLENNTPYMKIVVKKFHKFKMLEIINEREVKVHFEFIHPIYETDNYHRIYFSENLEYMLEKLIN